MMASAGNKSVISNDMQELNQGQEDVSKTIQGHKANLSNPSKTTNGITHSFHVKSQSLINAALADTSDHSKKHSAEVIESLGGEVNHYGQDGKPHSKSAADQLEGSRVI